MGTRREPHKRSGPSRRLPPRLPAQTALPATQVDNRRHGSRSSPSQRGTNCKESPIPRPSLNSRQRKIAASTRLSHPSATIRSNYVPDTADHPSFSRAGPRGYLSAPFPLSFALRQQHTSLTLFNCCSPPSTSTRSAVRTSIHGSSPHSLLLPQLARRLVWTLHSSPSPIPDSEHRQLHRGIFIDRCSYHDCRQAIHKARRHRDQRDSFSQPFRRMQPRTESSLSDPRLGWTSVRNRSRDLQFASSCSGPKGHNDSSKSAMCWRDYVREFGIPDKEGRCRGAP